MSTYVDFEGENIVYHGSRPFFFHANGNGVLDNVIRRLGMNLDHDRIKDEMLYGLIGKLKHYGFIMLDTYKYSILLLILLILIIYMYNKSSTNIKIGKSIFKNSTKR